MLLFLLSSKCDRPVPGPPASEVSGPDYTSALLAAALFLSVWCLLRLGAAPNRGVDLALAAPCLGLGVGTSARCLRKLQQAWRRARAAPCPEGP